MPWSAAWPRPAVPDSSNGEGGLLGACWNGAPNPFGGPASEQHASNRKIDCRLVQ